MKYRIVEHNGKFFPESRAHLFARWKSMGSWHGIYFKYSRDTLDEARRVLDLDVSERHRSAVIEANTKYHSYP